MRLRTIVPFVVTAVLATVLFTPGPSYTQQRPGPPSPVSIASPLPVPVSASSPLPVTAPSPIPVSLSSGSVVSVGNPAAQPVLVRDVDESAKEPFSLLKPFSHNGGTELADWVTEPVPTGKRLVIEHVSIVASFQIPDASGPEPHCAAYIGGFSALDLVPMFYQGSFTSSTYFFASCVGSVPTKVYLSAGQRIMASAAYRGGPTVSGGYNEVQVFVSGYYVPAQ